MRAVELIPIVFLLFAALAIAVGIYGWRAAKARRAALAALAAELGCRFSPNHDSRHDDHYRQFAIFQQGHSRYAFNTLRGDLDLFGSRCPLLAGDFHYATDSIDKDGKTTTTQHTFSFLIANLPWSTPKLLVRPEGMFDKLKAAFGFDDIDFESAEFSRKFYVQSSDKRFAYDVLHPRMMEFLLAERPPMLAIDGGALCVTNGSSVWQPNTFRARMDFVRRFSELMPRHLLQDLKT